MKNFKSADSVAAYGMSAMGAIILLVFLALTTVFILLMVNVSGWFVIGVIIFGGYSVFMLIWTAIMIFVARTLD